MMNKGKVHGNDAGGLVATNQKRSGYVLAAFDWPKKVEFVL